MCGVLARGGGLSNVFREDGISKRTQSSQVLVKVLCAVLWRSYGGSKKGTSPNCRPVGTPKLPTWLEF